ncbi:MAG: FMN-binding glutamate synthase family protein, partial [Planctomycetota bacterium]
MSIREIRTHVYFGLIVVSGLLLVLGWWWGLLLTLPLVGLGTWDLMQTRHSLLRNYPVIGHLRFLLEEIGPELRQYIVESNTEGEPFNRDTRSLLYQRAKNVVDKKPFGTEVDVYAETYAWLAHSMMPKPVVKNASQTFRVDIGGPDCAHPYSSSVLNISAMSFGSLSPNAILA